MVANASTFRAINVAPSLPASSTPGRPRPPKPSQPRDDGQSRSPISMRAGRGPQKPAPPPSPRPWPRDPGNGRQMTLGPQPRDDGKNGIMRRRGGGGETQPRDPGTGGRTQRPVQPRDIDELFSFLPFVPPPIFGL
ncbi:hypothetical protein K431DRAFT_82914 [Polychaeton citri CBS 116435]|uniref:Uncharacterized protein n=1 Tax=Polychaeton citri CBS 116435 TaxID=1314669 RepID=A0A9P4URK0_9PEZI|nr:hypothetical protein K431DRAFT_82914 [Polychaeton citri CBS 116435]